MPSRQGRDLMANSQRGRSCSRSCHQDPSVFDSNTVDMLRAVVRHSARRGPARPKELAVPGHRLQRFREPTLYPPTKIRIAKDLDDDRFGGLTDTRLPGDPDFRNQNVYAVASRTLATFERALGRRVPWSFSGHQLLPGATRLPRGQRLLRSECQRHPIRRVRWLRRTADEPAARDGLFVSVPRHRRPRDDARRPRWPAQSGSSSRACPTSSRFTRLSPISWRSCSAFSIPKLVAHSLGRVDDHGRIPKANVDPKVLRKSVLTGLADEMGAASKAHSGDALRRSVERTPSTAWRNDRTFESPIGAVRSWSGPSCRPSCCIWSGRMEDLISEIGTAQPRASRRGGWQVR